MGLLRGVIPVIPTPFTDNGQYVDYENFEKLIQMAVQDGAHALNIMPPCFAAPSQSMVMQHLAEISSEIHIPLIIQYAPALNGMTITADTFARISKNQKHELYIKLETSPTGPAVTALRNSIGDSYDIIVGNGGECMFEVLARGACAVMPGAALIRPYRMIYDAFEKGETELAFELFNRYLPHIHLMQRDIESFVAMEKIILKKRGIMKNTVCRKPDNYPDAQTMALLDRHLDHVRREFSLT